MQHIDSFNFAEKKALIRVDFNVPLDANFTITDDTRIKAAIPTIKKIVNDGGSVILMSHLGRPKGGPEHKYSLQHIVAHLSKLLGQEVKFADDCIGASAIELAKNLKSKEVLLLENLRFHKEEEKGDEVFAQKLASLGDVYVNDAFGTAHRAHASTAIMAKFFEKNKLFGYVMNGEIKSIDKVLYESERPFVAIIGGAKVSDKILIIENLLTKVNSLIIGGGMAFTFLKAQGKEIGNSICEEDKMQLALEVLKKAQEKGVNLLLPVDVVAADKFANDANTQYVLADAIPQGWMGLDIGKKSQEIFEKEILGAKTILWNGPMGVFEMDKFQQGTKSIAEAVAQATANGSFSLIGGGDSVAAINKYKLENKVSYVSTGGGAMLEYMEGKILPGVKAIKEN